MESIIHNEKDFLELSLGAFDPSAYLRSIYLPYTEEDLSRLDRQIKTGEPAYSKQDYENASSWKDKEHILKMFVTPYHEAFHYFQRLITSFGIFDQYVRTGRNNALIKILIQNNGLPGESLRDFLQKGIVHISEVSTLSRENLLLSGIMEGSVLYVTEEPKPMSANSIFKVIEVRREADILPQVCIEVNTNLYPIGAKILIESWAFSFIQGLVSFSLGKNAAKDYAEKLGIPFYPYKLLDYIVRLLYGNDYKTEDVLPFAIMVSTIAYYGLNHNKYNPRGKFTRGFFPGWRAASLIHAMSINLQRSPPIGTISDPFAVAFDPFEAALLLDEYTKWGSFLMNSHEMHKQIVTIMTEMLGELERYVHTFDFGASLRFMRDAATALLMTLSNTAIIFQIHPWASVNYWDSIEPPLSVFLKEINHQRIQALHARQAPKEDIRFWIMYYTIASIIEQKVASATWRCPLSLYGYGSCAKLDADVCYADLGSFDLPAGISRKNCPLKQILEDFKGKKMTGSPDFD